MNYDVLSLLSTPVRRGIDYENGGDGASDESWTAARCDSLIATLNSRIEVLKKDRAQYLSSTTAKELEEPLTTSLNILNLKKRRHTTYAKRARRGKEESNGKTSGQRKAGADIVRAPGETWGVTPFLLRSEREEGISQPAHSDIPSYDADLEVQCLRSNDSPRSSAFQPGPSQYQCKQILRQLSSTIPADQYDLSMRLCETYQGLLRAIKGSASRVFKPSESLLSMCLRAMPARMKLEQDLQDLDAKAASLKLGNAARDLSSEMYSEIRELDLGGQGGKHIKTILIAHGTETLADVIREGVLFLEFGLLAVMNCTQMGFKHESEVLMEAVATRVQESAPASSSSLLSRTTSFLLSCATSSATYFRLLARMFARNSLPISWLATKHFQNMWPRFYALIAGDVRCQVAQEFCMTVLPLLSAAATRSDDGLSVVTTFTSLVSNLCSIVLIGTGTYSSSGVELQSRVVRVLQHFMIDISEHAGCQQIYILALLRLLVEPVEKVAQTTKFLETSTASNVEGNGHHKLLVGILAGIICSVLDRHRTADVGVGIQKVRQLIRLIQSAPSSPSPAIEVLCSSIVNGVLQSAKQFSHGSEMDELKNIAQEVQISYGLRMDTDESIGFKDDQCSLVTPDSNHDTDQPPGCRWEEGIGEWIPITPAGEYSTLPTMRNGLQQLPSVSYGSKVRARVSYLSKRKHSSVPSRSQSFLDLVPSSLDGSDTEPDSSFLTEVTAFSDAPSSPREDHGFRAPPRKFRKLYSSVGVRHELAECIENRFPDPLGDSIRLRTPFASTFGPAKDKKLDEYSMHDVDSSGDELGC